MFDCSTFSGEKHSVLKKTDEFKAEPLKVRTFDFLK